jgi:hypothetical protein
VIALGDAPWALMYLQDDDTLAAVGCLLSSVGAAMVAFGLLRGRPQLLR